MSARQQRWPQRCLLLALLLFWLFLAALGGNWLLAYEQSRMQDTLNAEAQQVAGQVRERLGRLQQAAQQLQQDVANLRASDASADPGHYINRLRADFPALQRVALLNNDARYQGLPVRMSFPALPADQAALPAIAAVQPQLSAGQVMVLPWQERNVATSHVLLLPGADSEVLALWLSPASLLPSLPDTEMHLGQRPPGHPQPDSRLLYAHTEIRSGPFLLQLALQRSMGWEQLHSPRLWLLMICLLLALLVCVLSYMRFDLLRQRRQQLLRAQAAWRARQGMPATSAEQ